MIMVTGVNHKTCPVETREKLSFSPDRIKEFLLCLKEDTLLEENVILSTCNRTEFYYVSKEEEQAKEKILNYLSEYKKLNIDEFKDHLYFMKEEETVDHLFSVACGIDSMIIGEGQILGQIKTAFDISREIRSNGPNLCQLFRFAITCGKRARTETKISTGPSSISYVAVVFAKMLFGELVNKSAIIVGAGKMGQLTAKQLSHHGLKQVIIANRNYEKALEMGKKINGEAVNFDRLEEYLIKADIVISSTGAPHYVIHYDTIRKILKARKEKPLFLIDIAVPRDIEPSVNKLPNVFLYDIDDLQKVVENNLEGRKEETGKVKKIIEEEKGHFLAWANSRQSAPIIKALNKKAEDIRTEELNIALRKLSHLSAEDIQIIDYATQKIINKLLHNPIIKLKENMSNGKSFLPVDELITELFDLKNSGEN
ncbi:MAG: glutamyl-tRNA reductase [Candidatus Eremiobacterota bacterium]